MRQRRIAVSARIAELAFRVADGDVIEQRLSCDRCGVPVARIKPAAGRRTIRNVDGSLHVKTCTNRYGRLRATLLRGLDAPTVEEISSIKGFAPHLAIETLQRAKAEVKDLSRPHSSISSTNSSKPSSITSNGSSRSRLRSSGGR